MATATRKLIPPSPSGDREPDATPAARPAPRVFRAFDATFRFLASLKLAVISLATLSATLAYGTRFNSLYGQNAVNEYIYQTKGFALLLGFLGANILCAALIRYPWTKRQTGFVITHAGLLIVIVGSWWSAQEGDEGLLGMREGETSRELIRNHKPTIYIRPIDAATGKPSGEYRIPFRPGAFDWAPGRYQVVSEAKDPFKLAVKGFYPASATAVIHVPDPAGRPMLKLRPRVTPPGQTAASDVLPATERWFVPASAQLARDFKEVGPAQFIFTITPRADILDDFANPPADPGKEGVARLLYRDRAGKDRVYEVKVDAAEVGRPIPLPESDLVASFVKSEHQEVEEARIRRSLGADVIDVVQFKVRRGDGPEVLHNGYAGLPMIPTTSPARGDGGQAAQAGPFLMVSYFYPPAVDPKVNNRFGVVEVMADESGRLAYRVFGRGNPGVLKGHGPLAKGREVTAFGGDGSSPMTLTFAVEDYLKAGREETVAESVEMPAGKQDDALGAILAELTVNGVTKEVWVRKSAGFEPDYKPLAFPDALYEVAFDVDRLNLGFSLTLDDFDVGFDPGTDKAASYKSEVRLTDEAAGIKDQPRSIYMNHTLDHKGWRFFQTSFSRYTDPRTGRETGEFVSVFQVAKNPAREVIYLGCIVVVLGALVQFTMRAGIFTDGGKRKREQAAANARQRLEAKAETDRLPADRESDEPL